MRQGNRGWAKAIIEGVADLQAERKAKSREQLPVRTWLDDWIEPAKARDRGRRWLSMWLKGDLRDIPPEYAGRFLEEMAVDLKTVGVEEAVDRFIDKILPKILSNGPPIEDEEPGVETNKDRPSRIRRSRSSQ